MKKILTPSILIVALGLGAFAQSLGGSVRPAAAKAPGNKTNGATYNPDGIEMVYCAWGSAAATHGFYIGKYEVTQAQWQAVMGSNPSAKRDTVHPVTNVSWNEVKQFIAKLNERTGRTYRLPSEAEWAHAATGGSNADKHEYSGSSSVDEVAWYSGNSGWHVNSSNSVSYTHKVGTRKPNSAGIHDMSGNVWEWCEDCHDSSCSLRVIRGGSWACPASYCGISHRDSDVPTHRDNVLGFRLAL